MKDCLSPTNVEGCTTTASSSYVFSFPFSVLAFCFGEGYPYVPVRRVTTLFRIKRRVITSISKWTIMDAIDAVNRPTPAVVSSTGPL